MSKWYILIILSVTYWLYAGTWMLKSDYLIAKATNDRWSWGQLTLEILACYTIGALLWFAFRSGCLEDEEQAGVVRKRRASRGDPLMVAAVLFRDAADLKRTRRDITIKELEAQDEPF